MVMMACGGVGVSVAVGGGGDACWRWDMPSAREFTATCSIAISCEPWPGHSDTKCVCSRLRRLLRWQ